MNIALFITFSLALLVVVERLKRSSIISNNFSRRLAHLGAGIINIIAPFFVSKLAIIIVNVGFAVLLVTGRKKNYFSSIQTTSRKTNGDLYFPLGIIISAIIFLPTDTAAFQFGIAIMGISDGLAGLVGEKWGKRKIGILEKTFVGSLLFYMSSLFITFLFVSHLTILVFTLPLILSLIEITLGYGLDNLILPTVSSLLFLYFF